MMRQSHLPKVHHEDLRRKFESGGRSSAYAALTGHVRLLPMKRLVYLLVASCLVACGPPAQQAPVKQPVAALPVANETVEPAKEPPIIKVPSA